MATLFALLINPATAQIARATLSYINEVELQDLHGTYRGAGSWNLGDAPEPVERLTRLPRAHTTYGVRPEGRGWGTTLYTALSVGAEAHALSLIPAEMTVRGAGICSDLDARSKDATKWWRAARKRGLATILPPTEVEGVVVIADIYPAERAWARHLVVARIPWPPPGLSDPGLLDPARAEAVDPHALAAANPADFAPGLRPDAEAGVRRAAEARLGFVLALAERAGLSRVVRAGMEARARLGLDPQRGWSPPDYGAYRPVVPNPGPGAGAGRELSAVARRREALGWGALADL